MTVNVFCALIHYSRFFLVLGGICICSDGICLKFNTVMTVLYINYSRYARYNKYEHLHDKK